MGKNPIRGVPDPYHRYRVEEIGQRQSGSDQSPDEEPPDNGLLAQALRAIQKGIDAILDRLGGNATRTFAAIKTLKALKDALEVLKREDRSQDVEFLNNLSHYWNQAIEESVEYKKHEASALFKTFVKKILHYPEAQSHTFGYYLAEHAGQKWVPFPYMELIQKIHEEHERHLNKSALTEWVRLLSDIILLLEGS